MNTMRWALAEAVVISSLCVGCKSKDSAAPSGGASAGDSSASPAASPAASPSPTVAAGGVTVEQVRALIPADVPGYSMVQEPKKKDINTGLVVSAFREFKGAKPTEILSINIRYEKSALEPEKMRDATAGKDGTKIDFKGHPAIQKKVISLAQLIIYVGRSSVIVTGTDKAAVDAAAERIDLDAVGKL